MSSVILKHNQYVFYDLRSSAKLKEMLDGWNFDGVPPSSELVSQVLHHIIKCAVLISLWEWSSLFSTFPQILEYTVFVNQDGHQDAFMASSLNKFLGILMNNQSFQSQQIFEHRIHPSIFQTIYPMEDQRLNTESWRISILDSPWLYIIFKKLQLPSVHWWSFKSQSLSCFVAKYQQRHSNNFYIYPLFWKIFFLF